MLSFVSIVVFKLVNDLRIFHDKSLIVKISRERKVVYYKVHNFDARCLVLFFFILDLTKVIYYFV